MSPVTITIELPATAIGVAAEAIASDHRNMRTPNLSETARRALLRARAGPEGLLIPCTREVAVELDGWFQKAAARILAMERDPTSQERAAACLEAARRVREAIRETADGSSPERSDGQ